MIMKLEDIYMIFKDKLVLGGWWAGNEGKKVAYASKNRSHRSQPNPTQNRQAPNLNSKEEEHTQIHFSMHGNGAPLRHCGGEVVPNESTDRAA